MEEKKYLKWYNKVGYGTGDLAGNVVYAFLSSFVMLYLTNTVGLNPGVVGTLIMVSKLFDGVSDMFFGTLIDKTKSRLGKARPWMLYAEKLYAIHYLKEGQKFQKANDIAKAEESYKKVTTLSGKKWKTDALYSLGVLFYNNGATVLKKAAPLANSDADKYATEKAAADADFKKAADYLQEAATLSPERAEIKKMLTQVQESLN